MARKAPTEPRDERHSATDRTSVRPADWRRIAGRVALGLTLVLAAYAWWMGTTARPAVDDAHAYWLASLSDPYRVTAMGAPDAYHYSPAFLWLIAPLQLLPFAVFKAAWIAFTIGVTWWLAGRWMLLVLLCPPLWSDFAYGNINAVMGAAVVLSFRWPALWAFPILTKVAPGVGLLWFAFRREWQALAVALGATAAIVAIGVLIAPNVWLEWLEFIREQPGAATDLPGVIPGPPWILRVSAAVALVFWGARRDAKWTVPLAGMLVLPWWWMVGGLGLASLKLWRSDHLGVRVAPEAVVGSAASPD